MSDISQSRMFKLIRFLEQLIGKWEEMFHSSSSMANYVEMLPLINEAKQLRGELHKTASTTTLICCSCGKPILTKEQPKYYHMIHGITVECAYCGQSQVIDIIISTRPNDCDHPRVDYWSTCISCGQKNINTSQGYTAVPDPAEPKRLMFEKEGFKDEREIGKGS